MTTTLTLSAEQQAALEAIQCWYDTPVITVHKAQGSEWPHVYVVDQTAQLYSTTARREGSAAAEVMARRFLYTAVSRASERVTIASTTA